MDSPTEPQHSPVILKCVWPDYQPIKAEMDIAPIITNTIKAMRREMFRYRISRIMLINDVLNPQTNVARDVLKFEPSDVQSLTNTERLEFFDTVQEMASMLVLDKDFPSQAVQRHNDIYILMSATAATIKAK